MKERYIGLSIAEFVSIQDIYIYKKVNEHGKAVIRGIIDAEYEKELFKKAECGYATLFIVDETGRQQNIFSGIIEHMEVKNSGEVKSANVVLTGATKQMDCMEYTRTFQKESILYEKLLNVINSENGHVIYMHNCGKGISIKKLVVQYKETDWEFAKRLASHFNQPLIPNYAGEGIRYSFGLCADSPEKDFEINEYSVGNMREEYLNKSRNMVSGILPDDFTFYTVKSRDYLELGDKVRFLEQVFYVYEVTGSLEEEELIHTYILRRAGGFKTIHYYNNKIIGASLDASVIATQNDTVKVAVSVDKGQSGAKWFPYSTVYSSPDGTGWYCMPEKGDRVRLYFPSEREQEAYVISAINYGNTSEDAQENAPRSNPDRKSISNKQGKQIELTPTSIMMTNNNGMFICMDDEKGIEIKCNKNVNLNAEGSLIVKSDTGLDIQATDYIKLVQGSSKLILKDELKIEGTKFNVQ